MSTAVSEIPRGAFYRHKMSVGTSALVSVEGVDSLIGQNNFLVQDVHVTKREKQAIVQCFGQTNHVYAFGADPLSSSFSVTLSVFLANCGGGISGGDVGKAIGVYNGLRVSARKALVSMSLGGAVLTGTGSGFEASVENAQLNMFRVTFLFTDFQGPSQGGNGRGDNFIPLGSKPGITGVGSPSPGTIGLKR